MALLISDAQMVKRVTFQLRTARESLTCYVLVVLVVSSSKKELSTFFSVRPELVSHHVIDSCDYNSCFKIFNIHMKFELLFSKTITAPHPHPIMSGILLQWLTASWQNVLCRRRLLC